MGFGIAQGLNLGLLGLNHSDPSHPIATEKRHGLRCQGGDFLRLFAKNTTLTPQDCGVKKLAKWGVWVATMPPS